MRKAFSSILLFSLLVYMGGYHFIYSLYQQELKSEMKSYLKENHSSKFGTSFEFTLFNNKVTDPSFSWEEENAEFRYNHELYDIVRIEKKQGRLLIVCLKDNDENQLEKQVNEIHQNCKPHNSKTVQHAIKFFSLFCLQKQDKKFASPPTNLEKLARYLMPLNQAFFEIQLPPPRC